MLKGRSVLRDMVRELERAHAAHASAVQAVRDIEIEVDAVVKEEGRILDSLARIYLPELSQTTVSAPLAELRRRLEEVLVKQDERKARLSGNAASAAVRLDAAQSSVDALAEEAGALDAQLARARARVEATLDGAADHEAQVDEHAALLEKRQRLRKRRERLGSVALAERTRYEADRFFRYLHDRDFGGPGYTGGSVTRRLDRWIARRIDYETIARNYRILKLGPYQIGAEIRRLGKRAEELEKQIDARDEEAAREAGLLPLLQRRVELETRMSEARTGLEQARAARDALETELRAVEAHRGRHFEEAVELYRDYLERKTVRELEAMARGTQDPRDDGLVRELEQVRSRLQTLNAELVDRRDRLRRASERADRLAELRASGLDRFAHPRSFFPDGFNLGSILESFLGGNTDPGQVIEELEASHVEQPGVGQVPRPYFDALYRELTAAFDAGALEGGIADFDWEMDGAVETEVVVHDADGRVMRRRITRRSVRNPPGESVSS